MKDFRIIQGFIACSLFISLSGNAQYSDAEKKIFVKAEKFLEEKDYSFALEQYLLLLPAQVSNANVNYRIGQCYMNLLGQERNALSYLQKAEKSIDENYIPGSFTSNAAPPEALLLLGDSYMREEMTVEAAKAYQDYRNYVLNNPQQLAIVDEQIRALGITESEENQNSREVLLTNMGDKINTAASEYNIVYSGDMKTMAFTRYDKRKDVIFVSYLRNGQWTEPMDISSQINSQGDMYVTALSYNGQELYAVMLTEFDADLYVSTLTDGKWSMASNLGRNVNSKYIESSASISADGNTLFFASDRAGGVGGFDIYYSTKAEGKWDKAQGIGEVVNSKSNEESPFITESGNALYFSSDRSGSIGRMDIYLSTREGNGDNWTAPENLGMPYNSVEDDIAFRFYDQYNKGYLARDLPGGFGKLDIYLIQSGADRQREMADYVKSQKPKETETKKAEVTTSPVAQQSKEPTEKTTPVVATAAVLAVATPVAEEKKAEPVVAEKVTSEPSKTESTVQVKKTEPELPKKPAPAKSAENKVVEQVVMPLSGNYAIQILALTHPVEVEKLKGVDKGSLAVVHCKDGYTRYLVGHYSSQEEAISDLRLYFTKGYKDAFIRSTQEIERLK